MQKHLAAYIPQTNEVHKLTPKRLKKTVSKLGLFQPNIPRGKKKSEFIALTLKTIIPTKTDTAIKTATEANILTTSAKR